MEERHFRPRPFGQAYRIVRGRRRSMVGEMSTAQWERIFTSRKRTMMQKASDLEISTQCEVTLTIKSPAGQVWYYATSDQLRQKLASAEIINSTSFRVTRETLENNLIPTPESLPHSHSPQHTMSHQHHCEQPGLVSPPSSRADHCPNCQANRSSLPTRNSHSPSDHYSSDQSRTPTASTIEKTNPSDDHIRSTPVRDRRESVATDEGFIETEPAIAKPAGKKTKNATVQSQSFKTKNTTKLKPNTKQTPLVRSDTKNTPQNSKKNEDIQTNSGKKRKIGVSTSKPQNKKHIIFSESEDDMPDSKSSTGSQKTKPPSKQLPKQRQRTKDGVNVKRSNATGSVVKNSTQTDKPPPKARKIEQENSSHTSKKTHKNNAGNILGFARFPFQPPQHRFTTERELEEERKYLRSRPPENPTQPKPKTTAAVPSDSSSSTTTSSSDSSSSSDGSSDEEDSSSSSSSSSSSDESQISSTVRTTKAPSRLQTTTTVETIESSVESSQAEKSPPLPKIFLSKYEESLRKGGMGQPKSSFVKVEKNPYDFLQSPTKPFPMNDSEKTIKNNDEKEKPVSNAKSKKTTDKKIQEQRNSLKSEKTNHSAEVPSKSSNGHQTKNGKIAKNKADNANGASVKKVPQPSHPTIKQEYEAPNGGSSSGFPSNTKGHKFSSGDGGKEVNSKNVKSVAQNSNPKPESVGAKHKNGLKPASNVGNDAEKLSAKKQIPVETQKRHVNESSNSTFKKARSRTPDNRPLYHSHRGLHFRRNSESWNNTDWQKHSYHRGPVNYRPGGITNRYDSYPHGPGQCREQIRMSRNDFLPRTGTSKIRSQSMDRGQRMPHSVHSETALPMQDPANSIPVRPLLSAEALSSLPGYYPLRRQNSATSLDGIHRQKSYGSDYYNENSYETQSYRSFDPNSDYELDDFEKQLKDKCFSLRDNPPKYQRFNEHVRGSGGFSSAGFRNSRLDRNLRNLSESRRPARGRSRSLSSQHNKKPSKQYPNNKNPKSPNRKPLPRSHKGKPQRPTPKKAVAEVKPFNQARNNERWKSMEKK